MGQIQTTEIHGTVRYDNEPGNWDTDSQKINWGAVGEAVLGAAPDIIGAIQGGGSGYTAPPAPPQPPAPTQAAGVSMTTVLIGLGVVIVIALVAFLAKS